MYVAELAGESARHTESAQDFAIRRQFQHAVVVTVGDQQMPLASPIQPPGRADVRPLALEIAVAALRSGDRRATDRTEIRTQKTAAPRPASAPVASAPHVTCTVSNLVPTAPIQTVPSA